MKSKSQKYEEAISRNLPTFLNNSHRKTFYKEMDRRMLTVDVIDRIKQAIGIKGEDTRHDIAIRAWILI